MMAGMIFMLGMIFMKTIITISTMVTALLQNQGPVILVITAVLVWGMMWLIIITTGNWIL